MPTHRWMSTMFMTSGIADDAVVNTWHTVSTPGDPDFGAIRTAWALMMENNRGWFNSDVRQNDHTLKAYDLSTPEPRAPVYEATWNFTAAPSGTPLPSEVAVCISFQGARVSGEDQARRRGRIFLGPIQTARLDGGRPQASLLDDLATNMYDFIEDVNDAGAYFVVRSRANDDDVIVRNIWVDNTFDTQRRRGLAVTTRQSLNITQTI